MVHMPCQTVLLDGAMGTRLQQEGLPSGTASPTWNIEKKDAVREVHRSYLNSGARVLLTNTFGAQKEAEFRGAIDAVQFPGGNYQIAGSIGPTTGIEFVSILVPVVDFLVMETFSELAAARKTFASLKAFRRQIALSLTWAFNGEFRLRSGETVKQVIQEIRYWPLLALGANCMLGSARLAELGKILAEESPFDVWIKANAGQPRKQEDRFVYDQDPEQFASDLQPLIGVVRYLGGCCGTDERHVKALQQRIAASG